MFTLVIKADGTSWVLDFQQKTFIHCQSDIAWQRRGGFKNDYAVCSYAGDGVFREINGHREFRPRRGPYTEHAWSRFLDEMNCPPRNPQS